MTAESSRLLLVLLDELKSARPTGNMLPFPGDARLSLVVKCCLENLEDAKPIAAWADMAGFSERNFRRLFSKETGMTFGKWRQWARLLKSQEYLANGISVREAAWAVGYDNVSAFIAAFKNTFGQTPGTFITSAI